MLLLASLTTAFSPWRVNYACSDPDAAAHFAIAYLGAREPTPVPGRNASCAKIRQVDFAAPPGGRPFELSFVDSFDKRGGSFTPANWTAYASRLYGNLSTSSYTAWADNHAGIYVPSIVPYLDAFDKGGVEFFTRRQTATDQGCDVVLLPGCGQLFELRADDCPASTPVHDWNLCEPTNVSTSLSRSRNAWVVPWKMTFASSDPAAAAAFVVRALGGTVIAPSADLNQSCGTVRWLALPKGGSGANDDTDGFQLHFVYNPRKRTGPLTVERFEKYLSQLHGNLSAINGSAALYDQWLDSHVALLVDDVTVYTSRFDALGVPYFTRGELEGPQEIFVEAPGGIIIDIAHSGRAKTPLGLAPWHLCTGDTA